MQGPDAKLRKPPAVVNSGTWSPAEDARLKEAVLKYGTRWVIIASAVGTRNGDQCAKRWNENLNPELDHSPWSPQEENLLLHLVDVYGHNWKFMASSFLEGRAPLSLKNRYSLLMRRLKRQGQGAKQLPSPSDSSLPTIELPSRPPGSFDLATDFCSGFLAEAESCSSGRSAKSQSDTDGELTSPMSRVSSARDFNAIEVTPNTSEARGTAHCLFTPASMGGVVQAGNHLGVQGGNQSCWEDYCAWPDMVGVGSRSKNTTEVVDMAGSRQSCDTSTLTRSGLDVTGTTFCRQCQTHDPTSESSVKNAVQYSVSCQRGKLKTLVCHLVDAAMSESTIQSSEKDEVTLTLRLEG